MTTFYDVPADALNEAVAEELADDLEAPEWAAFAKTGVDRELPPEQEDFWQVRAAALLRTVAADGPVGVERLASKYGDAKRGSNRYKVRPAEKADGSSNVIRTILQQLEEAGYVETAKGEGRRVTGEGRALLDSVATEVLEELAAENPELERYA